VKVEPPTGRGRVKHCQVPVSGRLVVYHRPNDDRPNDYRPVPGTLFEFIFVEDSDPPMAILYFERFSTGPDIPPPVANPGAPPNVSLSTDLRLALPGSPQNTSTEGPSTDLSLALQVPVADSNQANPTDLWLTGQASGQQLPTSTAPQGPQWNFRNPDISRFNRHQ
jgi:hypothetical protein